MPQAPPNTLAPRPPTAPPPAAPAQQAQAQPPAAPTAQPPQSQQQPGQPNLPHYWEVPTGQQSQQFQQARELEDQANQMAVLAGRYLPNSPQARQATAIAQALMQKATELKGLDTIVQTQEGPIHVLTGQFDPRANYQWDAKQGAYIDTTNTHPPITPRMAAPRQTTRNGVSLCRA